MININDSCFYEKINFVKLKIIIDKRTEYENIVDKEKDADGCDKKASVWAIMKKMYKQVEKIPFSQYGYIKIKYQKGKNCNDIGRWYAENGIGLAPIKSCIRHTICDDIWVDIDQVNSHPTILKQIMKKHEFSSPLLNKYVENREEVLKDIMTEEGFTKDNAKDAVISTLNGKSYKSKTLLKLHDELGLPVNNVMTSKEYIDFYNYCKNTFGDKCNLWGKTMSRILQYEENKMLECYISYCYNKGLIEKYKDGYKVSLVFDGFQLMKCDAINDELLEELRLYALEKTGFDVKLKVKPFENALKIPDEYYDLNNEENKNDDEEDDYIDQSIKSYEDTKIDFEKNKCKIMFPPSIYTFGATSKDQLQNFKNAKDTYGDIICYVVEKNKKKLKKFIYMWIDDPKKRKYTNVVWKPTPLVCDEDEYNIWKPLDIVNIPLIKTERDYWKEFLTFCNNLFETKEVSDYILARYAFKLQNLGLRTHVLVIYNGLEGAGKSTFIEVIYKLFGMNNIVFIDDSKKLYEKHSTFEKEKYFLCVNEASGTDNFKNSDILKTRITANVLSINPKGIQAYDIENLCDYDMTTNNTNVVKITDDSTRRWFQLETSNHYLGNVEFFNDFKDNIFNNDKALRQIYEGLINFNWKDVVKSGNFQDSTYKPITDITKMVKESNRDKMIWFFKDLINDYTTEDEITTLHFTNKELFKFWRDWCDGANISNYDMNIIQFGIKTTQLNKKVFAKIGEYFINKHIIHSSNITYRNQLLKFIDTLDEC